MTFLFGLFGSGGLTVTCTAPRFESLRSHSPLLALQTLREELGDALGKDGPDFEKLASTLILGSPSGDRIRCTDAKESTDWGRTRRMELWQDIMRALNVSLNDFSFEEEKYEAIS